MSPFSLPAVDHRKFALLALGLAFFAQGVWLVTVYHVNCGSAFSFDRHPSCQPNVPAVLAPVLQDFVVVGAEPAVRLVPPINLSGMAAAPAWLAEWATTLVVMVVNGLLLAAVLALLLNGVAAGVRRSALRRRLA